MNTDTPQRVAPAPQPLLYPLLKHSAGKAIVASVVGSGVAYSGKAPYMVVLEGATLAWELAEQKDGKNTGK